MIETDILTALQTAAIAAVAAITPALPVMAIGRTFNPTTDAPDDKWVEFVQIVNNRTGDYYDDGRVYQGTFRMILHWPIDDTGAYPPTTYLDQLASFFPKRKLLESGQALVRIYENPLFSGSIVGASELLYPLGLLYRCYKP